MKILNHKFLIEFNSLQPITHFRLHRYPHYSHLVWWKLSVLFGVENTCNECNGETELGETVCQSCYENNHCECGQRLEDAYGTPGDGFCVQCR